MTEMQKLNKMLAKADIPFEVYPYTMCDRSYFQLCYPNKQHCIVDAVSTEFTYGGREGLIEIMWEGHWEEDDVLGHLTANEAFQFFDEAHNGINNG